MFSNRILLVLIASILLINRVNGQSFSFKHYQVENGLSNNAVICCLQDKYGFVWFGTKDGLNRFDGYSFKVFRNNPADSGSIGNNFIQSLYEDPRGALWVGNEKGLYKYNPLTESFSLIPATAHLKVVKIAADGHNNIWFIDGLTLYKYNEKTARLIEYSPQQYFEASSICTSSTGEVWVSTSNGWLEQYTAATNSFSPFNVFKDDENIPSKWIEKIQFDNTGTILVGTADAGLKLFDVHQKTTQNIRLNKGSRNLFVRSFLQTSPGEYWVGTEAGIFIYNRNSGKVNHLTKKYNDPYSLSDNAIYSFCKDNEGGVWTGTYFGGINYYPPPYTPFKRWIPKIGENSISGNVVREITKDQQGNLWIGTEDAGLNKMNAAGSFSHYQPSDQKGSLSYFNIHGLLVNNNELWIGTFEHGLDVMNIHTGKVVRHYQMGPHSALKSNFVYTIHKTADGEIYIGTSIGLYQFNEKNKNFDTVARMPLYNWYTSILKDENGVLWTGTYGNGVNYLDTHTGERRNFRNDPLDRSSISSDRINSIFQDRNKNLWFATEDGLCKWNYLTHNFHRYGTADGFPSNFIMCLLEDENNNLWISTTKGLVCFNPSSHQLKVYTISNGLLSDQLNFSSAYKEDNGHMYFGSAKGMISFQPAEFMQTRFIPPVYITGFQVNNKEVLTSNGTSVHNSVTFTDRITLAYNQRTFSIDFAALSYTAPEMLKYAYKLEGLSNEWTQLKKNQKVYFTEIAPGTYLFKVKATNSSGVWNARETTLTIIVLPPWWKSWWAYLFYTLCIVLIAFSVLRMYHFRMKERARRNLELLEIAKEKELYHAKMEFFTNVAHEIRTPLTLIKGPLDKIIRKAAGIQEMQTSLRIMERNTNRLLELTNELLDFRQTEINGYSLSFVSTDVSELLEEIYQVFISLAEQSNIEMQLILPPDHIQAHIDQGAFTKIIYNLCSNALKYASSKMTIEMALEGHNQFVIKVKSDGIRIPETVQEKIFEPFFRLKETHKIKGSGIGLALSRSLALLLKGNLVLAAPEENMNTFILTLPVQQGNEITFTSVEQQETIRN